MRVAIVGRYPPTHCGVAEYTRMLTEFMISEEPGLQPFILSTTESFEAPYVERESRVKVYPCFRHKGTYFSKCLETLAEVGGVDVLHVQHEYGIFGETDSILRFLARAEGEGLTKASVITMHTVQHPLSGKEWAVRFQRLLGRYSNGVIVHSRLQEFELYSEGVDLNKILRIPHGTLLNPYLGHSKRELLQSLNMEIDIEKPIIALPGFVRRDKGADVILQALDLLPKKPIILVAGEPKDEDVAAALKSNRDVVFLPKYLTQEEMLKMIALADIVVLPYKDRPGTYSVSGVLHLSMGALKPVIGTRVPRLVELYENARRLVAVPGDAKDLALRLKWVMDAYDYAITYASNLYSYAVRVQWSRMARRHVALYKRLVKSPGYEALLEYL